MKQFLFILFLLSFYFNVNSQQLKTYDIVRLTKNPEGKTKLIYFTGLWCKPCMSKLKPLMDTFSKRNYIDFMVLFDRYGMTAKSVNMLSQTYDTSYFGLLPEKYYPVEKSHGLVTLKLNAPKKSISAFVSDYNNAHNATFTTDDIWVGVTFVQKRNSIYITKEYEIEKIINEIDLFLKSTQ